MKPIPGFTLRASLWLFKSAPDRFVFVQRKDTKRNDPQHPHPYRTIMGTLRCLNEPAACELASARAAHPEVPDLFYASRRV